MENTKKRWVRGSCVGKGAYGTVNLAVDLAGGDVFAVKSVDLASALPFQVQALENEISILKSISSPFIVAYLGDDTTSEAHPLASTAEYRNLHMEYLPRGTAAAAAAYDEEAVRSYTWCLVSALGYLHSRGIVHCDVKGKNVLLGPSPGSAKLADFGSAVEISSASAVTTRGSPLWMAPEVMRGEYQGPKSDVWSLGCTVIEMMTGKPVWDSGAHSIRRIGYSEELPLFPAGLSSVGRDFLEKCFRRDYKRRWSCDQLLQHPFVSMCSRKDLTVDSSPRCILDWFDNLDFDADESDGEGRTDLNLGAKERIRGLASGGRANWESDGWVVVRGGVEDGEGTKPEYCYPSGVDDAMNSSIEESNSNSSTLPTTILSEGEEQSYSGPYDAVSPPLRVACNVNRRIKVERSQNNSCKFLFLSRCYMNFDGLIRFLLTPKCEFSFIIFETFFLMPNCHRFEGISAFGIFPIEMD